MTLTEKMRKCNITKNEEIIDKNKNLHFSCVILNLKSVFGILGHIISYLEIALRSVFGYLLLPSPFTQCSFNPYDVKGRRHFLLVLKGIVVLHIQQCQLILIRIYTWPTQNSNKENGQICVLILLFLLNVNVFFASNVTLVTFEKQ